MDSFTPDSLDFPNPDDFPTPFNTPMPVNAFRANADNPSNVLVVDDSALNGAILNELLSSRGYGVRHVKSGKEALQELAEREYDLVCLDVLLPDLDGFEVCRKIRESGSFGHLPVLMVSAHFTDERNVVKGLEIGANDYVRVPFAPIEFLGRVSGLIRMKKAEDRLRAMALEDALTRLGNRALFFRRAEEEFARALRHDFPLSLALLDVDNFKDINDTFGHPAGDEVLKGIATLIRESIRREDVAARWGGDEFAILCVDSEIEGTLAVITRIHQAIKETDFSLSGHQVHAQMSVGLGQMDPGLHSNLDMFLADVDGALYRAKNDGKGKIVLAH